MILRFGAVMHYGCVRSGVTQLIYEQSAHIFSTVRPFHPPLTPPSFRRSPTPSASSAIRPGSASSTRSPTGQLCVRDIAERIGISESAVSHQLRLMRGMRIVRGRREGRCVYYTLDDQHVLDLFQQGAAPRLRGAAVVADLRGLRGPRRVGLQDRRDGLPRGSGDPRAAAEGARRARGARRRHSRPAAQHQVRRGEADTRRRSPRRWRRPGCARGSSTKRRPARRRRPRRGALFVGRLGRRSRAPAWRSSTPASIAARWWRPTLLAIASGGVYSVRRALHAARSLALDINVLMLVAVAGAMVLGAVVRRRRRSCSCSRSRSCSRRARWSARAARSAR